MLRSRLAALTAALVLAAPGAAFAQSAGDDQYEDPFGGEQEQDQEQEQPQPAPAPETPASSATPTPTPAATTSQAPQLPRTGADEGLVALAGAMLMAGGLALRIRLSESARGRR